MADSRWGRGGSKTDAGKQTKYPKDALAAKFSPKVRTSHKPKTPFYLRSPGRE